MSFDDYKFISLHNNALRNLYNGVASITISIIRNTLFRCQIAI